jgi:hypothetical protein
VRESKILLLEPTSRNMKWEAVWQRKRGQAAYVTRHQFSLLNVVAV